MLLLVSMQSKAQPAREVNCFRNFNVNAVGRNDVNAYLLMELAYVIYSDKLALEPGVSGGAIAFDQDTALFKREFIKRTKHFFYDPNEIRWRQSEIEGGLPFRINLEPKYDFVTASNAYSIDPEVMLISTHNAVYVVARGTDRIGGAQSNLVYQLGEWFGTDFKFLLEKACLDCEEHIHRGFYNAIHYTPGTQSAGYFANEPLTPNSYIMTLTAKIKAMVGNTDKKVWITGHSLGSAIGQLIGFYLKKYQNITAQEMILFAAPHPGSVEFVNTLNALFPNGRIQRYDFIEDPITKLAGRLMCIPGTDLCYGHAGVRNNILYATGPNHIKFNDGERLIDLSFANITGLITGGAFGYGGACWHNQEWYSNACFNQLSQTQKSRVPLPPPLPTTSSPGCSNNPFDISYGTSGNYFDPGSVEMEEGTYTIKNKLSGKYLIASKRNCPINTNNCCQVIQNGIAIEPNDDKWILKEVSAIYKSYTLTNMSRGTVLDADAVCGNSDNCKVQNCNRIPFVAGLRTNQEWAFKLSNGNYKLRCVAGDKFLRVDPNNILSNTSDECPFILFNDLANHQDQEFILTKLETLPEGIYKIRAINFSGTQSNKFLDLDHATDGDIVCINSNAPSGNTWRVKAIANGFTIRNVEFRTYLDADYHNTGNSGCKVQGWKRTTGGIISDTRNQEWFISIVSRNGNNYKCRVTNVKSPDMYLDSNDDAVGGTPVVLYGASSSNDHSQEFIFEKQ